MTEPEPIICMRDVRCSYTGQPGDDAVSGVTLDVHAGERIAVLGPNGSGKSTLLQLMCALLLPCAGSIRLFGIDPVAEPERIIEARRHEAMVFQYPEDQMVTSIVADDVAFGPENLGVPRPQIARRVERALDAVGMAAYAQADPEDLSGGQRQRVAIAGALAMEPEALLLDEPTAMLDEEGSRSVLKIVGELGARGIATVHVTHNADDALAADRVIVMDKGKVALAGTPQEVFSQAERLESLDLELPFLLQVRKALMETGLTLPYETDAERFAQQLARALAKQDAPLQAPQPSPDPKATRRNGPEDPAISFEGVSFSYAVNPRGRKRKRKPGATGHGTHAPMPPLAVQELTFSVPAGSLTALVGRTGAGKSTAVELACALKLPYAGRVTVAGIDTADLAARPRLRSRIGYVAQLPERQLFAQTVRDDLAFGPRNLGLAEDEVEHRIARALKLLGLPQDETFLQRSPFALSGGQQRAVALAGVLAMEQPILVLDEPLAGLDHTSRARMLRLLDALKRRGTTLLMVTHAMDDVAQLADRVIVLDGGRIAAQGMPREIFENPQVTGAAGLDLGEPRPAALAHLLARHGIDLPRIPLTVPELVWGVCAHGAAR